MKLLLDENLPRDLRGDFPETYDVFTVEYMGWKGITNGSLLDLMAQQRFDALLTVDKSMSFQQSIEKFPIMVIVMRARRNTHTVLRSLVPKIVDLLEKGPNPGLFIVQ